MITTNTTTMFEQLCNGFWFVSARAKAYDETRYELWIIPKAEVTTFGYAKHEAYEISENLLKDIWYDHNDEHNYEEIDGCCRFEFIDNPTKLKHCYDIAYGMYFYLPIDDRDRKIINDFIKSL